jgi:FAD synthase
MIDVSFASKPGCAPERTGLRVVSVASRVPPDLRGTVILLGNFDGLHVGFGVTVVPDFKLDGNRVSSTSIRREIEAGFIARANSGLGGHWVTPLHVCEAQPFLALDPSLVLPPAGSYAVRLISRCQESLPLSIVIEEGNRITAGEARRLPAGEHLVEWLG